MRPGLPTYPETSPIVAHACEPFGPLARTSRVDAPLQDVIDGGHAIYAHLSAEQSDSVYTGAAWLGSTADGTPTEFSVILLELAATS